MHGVSPPCTPWPVTCDAVMPMMPCLLSADTTWSSLQGRKIACASGAPIRIARETAQASPYSLLNSSVLALMVVSALQSVSCTMKGPPACSFQQAGQQIGEMGWKHWCANCQAGCQWSAVSPPLGRNHSRGRCSDCTEVFQGWRMALPGLRHCFLQPTQQQPDLSHGSAARWVLQCLGIRELPSSCLALTPDLLSVALRCCSTCHVMLLI